MSDGELQKHLGSFGGTHIDAKDSAGGVTAMTNLSKLPTFMHGGFFYLLEIGVYWVLEEFMTVLFCGLRFHCGSEPTYPDHSADLVPHWATRLTLVCYASSSILDGGSIMSFAAHPKHRVLTIGPEMMQVDQYVSLLPFFPLLAV